MDLFDRLRAMRTGTRRQRLTDEERQLILEALQAGLGQQRICQLCGVGKDTVYAIKHGRLPKSKERQTKGPYHFLGAARPHRCPGCKAMIKTAKCLACMLREELDGEQLQLGTETA